MRKIIIVLFIFLTALFSITWGQEINDTKGPIQGGFQNYTDPHLLIVENDKVTGVFKRSYLMKVQSHSLAVIEVYSFTGKWICKYIVDQKNVLLTFTFPFPRGIYFIKVGEKIREVFLSEDNLVFMLS